MKMIKLTNLVEAIKKEEKSTLYYKEGGSDKVYTAVLKSEGSGWLVNAQWGRRGNAMQTGTKTNSPVSYEEAKKIYDTLIKSKMAKGYTPGKTDKVYTSKEADKEKRKTGTYPQLLNPISQEELNDYMNNNSYGTQEKYDGKRIIIDIGSNGVIGINRKGLAVELPEELVQDANSLQGETLDGELVGDTYYTFDLLKHEGKGIYTWPYKKRYDALSQLQLGKNIVFAPLAIGKTQKQQMFDTLKNSKKEGIVFKDLTAPYKSGRPLKGGTQLKHKFWESTTAEVSRINAKRSIGIKVLNDSGNGYVDVGNCTVPPNYPLPEVGDMVEIKYLYVLQKGGSLYQPQYLGVRDDKDAPDKESQLKFKK